MTKDEDLQSRWGGLSMRAAKALQKGFGVRSLRQLIDNFPSGEKILLARGVGGITLRELRTVLPTTLKKRMNAALAGYDSPTYITKIEHLARRPYDPSLPRFTRETSEFFHALVDAARKWPEGAELPSQVPCMAGPIRGWCLGIINVVRQGNPQEIHWKCPLCGFGGVIRE